MDEQVRDRAERQDLRHVLGGILRQQRHARLGAARLRLAEERVGVGRMRRAAVDDDEQRRVVLHEPDALLEVIRDVDAIAGDAEDALHDPLGLAVRVDDQDRLLAQASVTLARQIPLPVRR